MKKNLSRIVPLLCRSLCFAVAFGAAIVSIPPARAATDIQYARGFRVESFAGCRLVSVTPQWQEDTSPFRYLLVPRGTAPPKNHPPAQVIVVPVRRVVALSTTHLGYLDAAGLVDCLVGLSSFKYVNSPSVRRRIAAGNLRELGHAANLQVEVLLDLSPDLILTPASGSTFDVHPKLLETGLPTALVLDHLEPDPLGRCEWIKFIALFFGTEDHAETLFRQISAHYHQLAALAAHPVRRPTVVTNTPFRAQWWVPGGDSYVARIIRDAGGDHLWSAEGGVASRALDIEAVYDRALNADVWLNTGVWTSIAEALAADPRFGSFRAIKTNQVFNNNKRLNQWGGNDYWESGILRPDIILADLIAILQPDRLPDHELVYYRQLDRLDSP